MKSCNDNDTCVTPEIADATRDTAAPSFSPPAVKAMIEGVVRAPSELAMICGSPLSKMATHEFVVPRSIPMTLPIP